MKKSILPILTAATVLSSAPAFAQMNSYHDPFNSLFDTMLFNPPRLEMRQFAEPKMDVIDLGDKIEVKAELPGIDENDVTLTLSDGILTLSGERKQEVEEQSKGYYLKEMSSGSFSRSIRLPANIDEDKINATFKNGILIVTVPKIETAPENVKKIPINKAE